MKQVEEANSNQVDILHKRVETLLRNKLTEQEIIKELSRDGIDAFYTQTLINNIRNDKDDNRNFWKLFFGGVFFILAGLIINYFSYKIAENMNSTFFYLFWGIVVAGVIMIFKAFIVFRK